MCLVVVNRDKFTSFIGPMVFSSFIFPAIVAVFKAESVQLIFFIANVIAVFYCVYIFLLTDWLVPHAIFRTIVMVAFHLTAVSQRKHLKDEFNVVPYFLIIITAMVFAELIGYLNMRTHVKLKLNMHSTQVHQG